MFHVPSSEELHSWKLYSETLLQWHRQEGIKKGFELQTLGETNGLPLWLLRPAEIGPGPRLLIAGTFHGEEPCGAWSILKFLMDEHDALEKLNVSFLPLVNPTGFAAASRYNFRGENPNRHFAKGVKDSPPLSLEGSLLVRHLDLLLTLGHDGFLSLHEDSSQTKSYLFTFEQAKTPGPFSRALLAALARHFPLLETGFYEECDVKDGLIFNDFDQSFEDLLFQSGVPLTACSETPCLCSPESRIACNVDVIVTFLAFVRDRALPISS